MAIKITSTRKSVHYVKMLVYGASGVGKTVLCGTAPKPIIISAESGLLSLSELDLPAIEVNTYEQVKEAYEALRKNKDYETICIDSLSEIAEKLLAKYKDEEKDARKAYGKMADDMSRIVRKFRDIDDKHIVFTAKQTRLVDEGTGKVNFIPMMPGKVFANNLPYFFDMVSCLRVGVKTVDKERIKYRYLQTQPSVQYEAKTRGNKLNASEEPNLTNFFNKVKGKTT